MSAPRRFQPYPAYKGSGVDWLEEIPAHGEVRRLKTIAVVQLRRATFTGRTANPVIAFDVLAKASVLA
jgi:hypothetical protein